MIAKNVPSAKKRHGKIDTSVLRMPKIQSFRISLSLWLQSCNVIEKETILKLGTALRTALGLNTYKNIYFIYVNIYKQSFR